jgi:hypothetical protein
MEALQVLLSNKYPEPDIEMTFFSQFLQKKRFLSNSNLYFQRFYSYKLSQLQAGPKVVKHLCP